MAAKLEKTRTPGIFKRGSRYVFSYRVDGKQRWESCRTLDEARRAKAARATDIGRGEFEERSRLTLHNYAQEWIERYQGTGRRGFREEMRSEYRALLDKYALRYFSARTKLTDITPRHIASFIGWLCEQTKPAPTKQEPDRRVLISDKTVRNAVGPLKACLATARREGLIRHNPATDVALPHRTRADDDEAQPRPFPRLEGDDGETVETMELVVDHVSRVVPAHVRAAGGDGLAPLGAARAGRSSSRARRRAAARQGAPARAPQARRGACDRPAQVQALQARRAHP
jgi:hypothetical protein